MRTCTVEGCDKPYNAKGYCNMHYNRVVRRGGTEQLPSPQQRFWEKVEKTDGCWNWIAGKNDMGYGAFGLDGKTDKAHRVSYEWANGVTLGDQLIDHICRNTACVRPSHLRIASSKQNRENVDGPPKHNKSSGVRGVTKAQRGRWQARVIHYGKTYSAKTHATIEEAEAAVIALRNQLFTHNEADRQQQQAS